MKFFIEMYLYVLFIIYINVEDSCSFSCEKKIIFLCFSFYCKLLSSLLSMFIYGRFFEILFSLVFNVTQLSHIIKFQILITIFKHMTLLVNLNQKSLKRKYFLYFEFCVSLYVGKGLAICEVRGMDFFSF